VENKSPYPNLDFLIHGYFNQDFDLSGNNVQEIVSCFNEENDQTLCTLITDEIDRLKFDHSVDLDEYFDEIYGFHVDPRPWGHTTASFLDELKQLLQSE
jgi:CdiI immunity protein